MAQGSRLPDKAGVRVGVIPIAVTCLSMGTGEPDTSKGCAVSRLEYIATCGGRSAGQRTARGTPSPHPKGGRDKRMDGKRELSADVEGFDPQRLRDRANAGWPAPSSPAVAPSHSPVPRLETRRSRPVGHHCSARPRSGR